MNQLPKTIFPLTHLDLSPDQPNLSKAVMLKAPQVIYRGVLEILGEEVGGEDMVHNTLLLIKIIKIRVLVIIIFLGGVCIMVPSPEGGTIMTSTHNLNGEGNFIWMHPFLFLTAFSTSSIDGIRQIFFRESQPPVVGPSPSVSCRKQI